MKVSIVGLNRFRSPSGVCISIRNFIECIQSVDYIDQIELIIGSWQVEYYANTLKVFENSKVSILQIDLPNTSYHRNKWFLFELRKTVIQANAVILGYPIPALSLKKPTITVLHDLYPFDYPSNFGFPNVLINQFLFFINLFITDAYLCVSKFTMGRLKRRFQLITRTKYIVNIYNYVPCKSIPQSPRLHKNDYWLCVAQHRKNKNIDLIIEAFSTYKLENRTNRLDLVIIGPNGPETNYLKALIDKNDIDLNVVFLSNLSDLALINYYQHSQITINASSIEGFGLPLIEACYYGNKIVASDILVYNELARCVPFFSLVDSPVVNLLKKIYETLDADYVKPVLNSELGKDTISRQISSLILETLKRNKAIY